MSTDLVDTETETAQPKRTARVGRPPKAEPFAHLVEYETRVRETTRLLRLASDPTRFRMLEILQHGELNVTEMRAALGGITQQAISHHLSLTRVSGLVTSQRVGKYNFYTLTDIGRKLVKAIARIGA